MCSECLLPRGGGASPPATRHRAFPVRAVLVGIGLFASSLPHWLRPAEAVIGALVASIAVIGRYWLARYPVPGQRRAGFLKTA